MKLVIPLPTAESLSSLFHDLPAMCSRHALLTTEVLMVLEKRSGEIKGVGSIKHMGVMLPDHQELTPLKSWCMDAQTHWM